MSDLPLISLSPPETLLFRLERDTNSKSILKVTNTSNFKIIFKIKTTQPTWYFVRPNQSILDIGQSENVSIVLVEGECNRFLDQVALNKIEKLDKHRFLVQSTVLNDDDFDRISLLPVADRTDEYTRVWDSSSKDEKKNFKLKVEFQYNDDRNNEVNPSPQTNKINENAENLRSKLLRSNNNTTIDSNDNVSALKNEYEALKKKYDAIVEYTVHLTAERDTIVAQLEETQRDLSRELTKKRTTNNVDNLNKNIVKSDKTEKKIENKGFSFFVVVFIAALCFALGRYANLIQY